MNKRKQAFVSTACAFALIAQSGSAFAQDKTQSKPREQSTERITVEPSGNATFEVRTDSPGTARVTVSGSTASVWRSSDGQSYAYTTGTPGVFFGGQQGGSGGGTFGFVAAEASFDGKVVKGAPYSAENVTEFTQVLPDGNRITRRNSAMVYRDSQGRTRREQGVMPMGIAELVNVQGIPTTTVITDPVEGVTYVLDQNARVARRNKFFAPAVSVGAARAGGTVVNGLTTTASSEPPRYIKVSGGVLQGSALNKVQPEYPPVAKAAHASGAVQVQVTISEKGDVQEASVVNGHPLLRDAAVTAARQWQFKPTELGGTPVKVQGVLTFNFTLGDEPGNAEVARKQAVEKEAATSTATLTTGASSLRMNFNRESLGKQMVEGVECEGTRMVSTIPAGQIGNERPIEIVIERWYSPELQLTVLTKQSDPRSGETVTRLTNLVRAEPDELLFKVPGDYTIKDENFGFRVEEKVRRPEER